MKKTFIFLKKQMNKAFILLMISSMIVFSAFPTFAEEGSAAGAILNSLGALMQGVADSFDYKDVMTIYISGIDTRGDMTEKSLSDVNILVTVNTVTKEVLLVTTPRDFFVPLSISNGVPDKLTHAGAYGIDVCVDTMEMLYDIDIDYYLRFNFKGFVNIIDVLEGVTVYSDYDFDSSNIPGYHFNEGENEMDGETALAFVRERYAFAEGDRQRGRNQMHMIEAVLKKLSNFDYVDNAEELLESIKGNYETNMPYGMILQFGLSEFTHLREYNVQSYSANGTGSYQKPYSMSENAYVMVPDMSTVENAKSMMAQVRGEN